MSNNIIITLVLVHLFWRGLLNPSWRIQQIVGGFHAIVILQVTQFRPDGVKSVYFPIEISLWEKNLFIKLV